MRPDWDTTWMTVAGVIALRSRCDGRQIGAVIVDKNNRPVATGYNGPPRGLEIGDGQSCSHWCPRRTEGAQTLNYDNCYTVHAEANALMFADRRDYEGGTLYVTSACCWDCGKMVANSGVSTVVMSLSTRDQHRDPQRTIEFLERCGIDVIVVEE